jgi:type IV pilus assembly protein PilQ
MCKTTKAFVALFLALSSVYSFQALSVAAEGKASQSGGKAPNTDVKLLDDTPSSAARPAPAPATKPAEGQSVGTQQVNVSDSGTVEIHVNEANLVEVLRMLSLQSQKNIIASKDVRGTVTANLYNVTIREALEAILKGNGYAYREKGNFIYVYGAKELADIEKAERQMTTEVFRLFYTPAANAMSIIKPAMSTEGQVSFTAPAQIGIESSSKEAGGNTHATEDILVVRDYPDNIEKVKKILKEVDRRPQQILVEATIVAARLTDDNNLGIDFNIVGGIDFNKIINSSGQLTNANLTDPVGPKAHSVGTGNNMTQSLAPGFKVGFVTQDISVFLNALEQVTDTVVLANPKVLTLNKQRGEVLVGREDGYKTTAVTETTTIQTVEFLKTGTRLIFRPYIGDDGYIRMEIHPEDSSGGLKNDLPFKTTAEVTTNIMVKDGHTIVIGGLFRESTITSRSQVPGLGSLPVVGALFRSQQDTTLREELIIMLTPHIVKDEKAYTKASEEELKDMEKLRVGVRRSLMPWARERLAEGAYDNAVKEMSKPTPNPKKAIWYLDCATNLNPKFLEAIKMKEGLNGQELTSVDNSSIRGFVKRQVLAERGVTAAVETSKSAPAFPAMPATPATPTMQPVAAAPAMQPAVTQAEADDDAWETDWVAEDEMVETPTTPPAVVETPVTEQSAAALLEKSESKENGVVASQSPVPTPTTQPSAQDVTVTELPVDEVEGQSSSERDQK